MANQNLKHGMEWFLAWQEAFKGKDEMDAAYQVVGQLLAYCMNLEERVKKLEATQSIKDIHPTEYGPPLVNLCDLTNLKSPRTINTKRDGE